MTKEQAKQLKPGDTVLYSEKCKIISIQFWEDGKISIDYEGGGLDCYPEEIEKVEE